MKQESGNQVMKQEIKRFDEMGLVFSQQQPQMTSTTIRLHQLRKTTFMGRPQNHFHETSTKPLSWDVRFSILNILQINLIYKFKMAYQ